MATTKKQRRYRRILLFLGILLLGWFSANWFLSYRLESYLNERLRKMISRTTDGFYECSFDHLSVGFFTGELTVEGLELRPDSAVYARWKAVDSLPSTYFNVNIDRIEFRGINLLWRIGYKKLRFDRFEVYSPDIEVHQVYPQKTKVDIDSASIPKFEYQTLYAYLSPHVDELQVKNINLIEANMSYIIDHPISPAVYALKGINFYAHGFLVDEYSYQRGKLLFCDDFDFRVAHPQTILSNAQFVMRTDSIRLNTSDSIIQLKGISFEPRTELWAELNSKPDEYLKANLASIELDGIKFSYTGGENILEARSFRIDSSRIDYFELVKPKTDQLDKKDTQQVLEESIEAIGSLSLYRSISPIFASVSVENIHVDNTYLQYTQQKGEEQDLFILSRLDAYAEGFLIDSLSEKRIDKPFWYSDNLGFKAWEILASMASKNHDLTIGKIALDIKAGYLQVQDAEIIPIDKNTKQDFLQGDIGNLSLDGMVLNEGIDIANLKLENIDVRYTSFAHQHKTKKADRKPLKERSNVVDMLSPFLSHLSIGDIRINNANIEFNDKHTRNIYSLRNTDAFITHFLIDGDTRRTSPYWFAFDDLGVQFLNFNNYLPGKDYRLEIGKGKFHLATGRMKLDKVKLTPLAQLKRKKGPMWDIATPYITVSGVAYDWDRNHFRIGTIEVGDPNLLVTHQEVGEEKKTKSKELEPFELPPFLKAIGIDELHIGKTTIQYNKSKSEDTLHFHLDGLAISNILLDNEMGGSVKSLSITNPYLKSKDKLEIKTESFNLENFHLNTHFENNWLYFGFEKLALPRFYFKLQQEQESLAISSESLHMAGVEWSEEETGNALRLNDFQLEKSIVDIVQHKLGKEAVIDTTSSNFDFYQALSAVANELTLKKVRVNDATINYEQFGHEEDRLKHGLKRVNIGIDGLDINTHLRKADLADLTFSTKDFNLPIDNGFYDLAVKSIDYGMKSNRLNLSGLSMTSYYAKSDFAYLHPKKKDWFNINVNNITATGIDLDTYFAQGILDIKHLVVDTALLRNLKNQRIEIEHNVMPMIYSEVHKLPIQFFVQKADVNNFMVVYEERQKKGVKPAKLYITDMYGKLYGLTNVVHSPQQIMQLDATGKLMGTGNFRAQWLMPVSKDYDLFELTAHLTDFKLADLNVLIEPMAPARIEGGEVTDLVFHTYATSLGATVNMRMLYKDLDLTIYRDAETKSKHKMYTYVVNKVLKKNNPDKPRKKPRMPEVQLARDPYHSTFNYMWQILQPPVVESVGVSKGKQNFFKRTANFAGKIKNFFKPRKKEKQK